MSMIKMVAQASAPLAPPAGYLRLFFNAAGTLCSIDSTNTVKVYSEGLTQEQVEDYVGNLLTDTSSVNVTYNDAGNVATLDVIPGGVNHNALLNYVANQHVDHSAVSVTAGAGLTGGGDLTASRTIAMPNVGTSGSYGSASSVPVITTDAQGRVSAVTATPIAVLASAVTNFAASVLSTVLTGYVIGANAAIAATDTVLGAFQKLQGQISALFGRQITAGTGLTGGGDLTADRTISMPAVGVAGTYKSVTTDAQGRVTAGTNPTTLAGFGITDAQPLDGDLTAVANLAGTGLVTRTATNTMTTRTVAAGTGIGVTNGDGVSGNPTIANTDTGSGAVATHVAAADPHAQYVLETTTVSAGAGLSGGGDLTTSRTISMPNTGTAGSYGSASAVPVITTDAQGRVTSVTVTAIAILAAAVTNFAASVLGVALTGYTVGTNAALAATDTILAAFGKVQAQLNALFGRQIIAGTGLTGGGDLTADRTLTVNPGAINHNALLNGGGTTHVDHAAVSLVAGTYMNGGGDITSSRTLNHANSPVTPGVYGSSTAVPVLTVGATGHVDGATTATINHNALLNGGGTTHTDHAAVSINAGTYMTGGGDLTASRTINHGNSAVTPATYGGVNAIPVLGIGATGHVDSASTVNPTAALLTGLAAGTNVAILATDTLLAALAKLQAQVDNLVATDNEWMELITTADIIASSNVTLTNVTELAFAAVAGRSYYLEYTIIFRSAATTTGITLTIGTSNTAAGTLSAQVNIPVAADGTAANFTGNVSSLGDVVTGTGVQTAQPTWFTANIKGIFLCTTSGTIVPQFRSEVNGSNVNFGTGSVALIREFA